MDRKLLCEECPYKDTTLMTIPYRMWLFFLSATATVIIPAIMMNTYHTFEDVIDATNPTVFAVLSIIPLALVMFVAFVGLYQALFGGRHKHCDRHDGHHSA